MVEREWVERVVELERRCRRLQLAVAGVTALGALACLSAARAPLDATVRAQRFELVNAAGEVRGTLAMDGTSTSLVLECPESEARVTLRAGPAAAGANSTARSEAGLASLALTHPNGAARLVADRAREALVLDGNGPHAMLLAGAQEIDEEGKPVAPRSVSALALLADLPNSLESFGHASLTAMDTESELELGTDDVPGVALRYAAGAPSLELKDSKEATRFRAP